MRRRTLLSAALAAPAFARAATATTLKIVPASDLAALDPVWTTAPTVRNHGYMVFDTLYATDAEFRVLPQMAEGHLVEDEGRLWTIRLRDGLRFHDGTAVLARDAVASIRRFAARDSFGETLMAATDELSAPDDRTIRFRLKQPFPLLTKVLGKPSSNIPCIMPERLALTDPGKQVIEMVGSGPYRFLADERVPGSRVAYQRFEGYVPRADGVASFTAGPKRAQFDRVEWQVIPDASSKVNALINGEVDWVEQPSTDLLDVLRASRKVVTRPALMGDLAVMVLNHLQPPFDNPAIRRALLPAISQTDMMRAAIGDDRRLWSDEVGVFNPGTAMDSRTGLEVMTGPRDLVRARQEIEAAGYKGERVVLLGAADLPLETAYINLAADVLKRIGMNVDLISVDWGTTVQRRASKQPVGAGGWSAFFTNLSWPNNFDPAGHLGLRSGPAAWFGWPSMPRMEALRTQWLTASDAAAQRAVCAEMERQFWVDVPYVPLGAVAVPTAYSASLTTPRAGILQAYDVARRA